MLVELLSISPEISTATGAMLGAFTGYSLNKIIVFKHKQNTLESFIKYMLMAVTSAILNTIIMFICHRILNFYYIYAQIIATGVMVIFNYICCNYWIFIDGQQKS